MDTTIVTAKRLEALDNPTRLSIYRALVRAGDNGLAVGGLQERLGVPASTLSHHLRTLMGVDLVTQERHGTTLICRANCAVMTVLVGFLFRECCAEGACLPVGSVRRGSACEEAV